MFFGFTVLFQKRLFCIKFYFEYLFQTEDDEFDHFTDDDEFEGFDKETTRPGKGKSHEVPDLKIAKVCTMLQPVTVFIIPKYLGCHQKAVLLFKYLVNLINKFHVMKVITSRILDTEIFSC